MKRTKTKLSEETRLKYRLYEEAVQSPNWQVENLPAFHRKFTGQTPYLMREDFSGSGRIACEWVKKSPKHRAVGLDLDPEALACAELNRADLSEKARERVKFIRQDVRVATREKFDLIGAYNFSFFVFHERCDLLRYARSAFASLKKKGTFFLELAGGDGFRQAREDDRKGKLKGVGDFRFIWEHHQYDPISAVCDYSIHFKLPHRPWMNDAFTYHWRIWEIRDVREVLAQAGFRKTYVLWEKSDRRGEGTGEYYPTENGGNEDTFIAFVVGVKG